MKKFISFLAGALVIAGCTQENTYDDSAVLEKIASLEQRVTTLESSIRGIQSAVDGMKYVSKFQTKTDETGKITALTVTYSTGETVVLEVSDIVDPSLAPVLSIMANGAGQLCWAINGNILTNDGKDVLVYQTPVFTKTEDGHLHVEVDGQDIDLGYIKGDKGDKGEQGEQGNPGKDGEIPVVQDGIIKDIEVTETAVVITYGDSSDVVSIPLVSSFALKIEKTEYLVKDTNPIEIPYTLVNATANTVVDVYHGSEISCEVKSDKIVVTPKSADVECMALVYADTKTGLTSIVKLLFEKEICKVVAPAEGYVVDFENGTVEVNVVSNIPFEVKPQADWLHYVSTKATSYTVTISADNNTVAEPRTGIVNIVRAGTDDVLQTIEIAQKPFDPSINLSNKESANCYIVSEAGQYKFATVKGNSAESVGSVASAAIVWETWNNTETVTANSVIASLEYEGGYIKFATPETLKCGNALIAAKDANGVILWSWHIWVTDMAIEGIDCGHAGETLVMNCNLGAIDVPGTNGSFGLQYQWGRKDPFMGCGSLGHSDLSTVCGTEMTLTTDLLSEDDARQNPTLFYYVGSNGKDWFAGSASDRWAESKTVNDPCPAGWRAARSTDNSVFLLSGGTVADMETYTFTADGVVFPFSGTIYYESGSFDKSDTIYHLADDYNTTTPKGWRVKSSSGSRTAVRKASGGAVRCVAVSAVE